MSAYADNLAPGCHECPKCGEIVFGSLALHECPEPELCFSCHSELGEGDDGLCSRCLQMELDHETK